MSETEWEQYVSKLGDTDSDPKALYSVLTKLRDNVDLFTHGQDYAAFAPKLIPALLKLLDGPPVFVNTFIEQQIRHAALEIIHRLPLTPHEAVKNYVSPIIEKLLELIKTDNEDNAIICIKTIMDLLRIHSKPLASYVQPFLKLILDMFSHLEKLVLETFDGPSSQQSYLPSTPSKPLYLQSQSHPSPGSHNLDAGFDQSQPQQLAKGMESFKVIAECPIAVVSIFQVHGAMMAESVKTFCPVIVKTLLLQVPAQEAARAEAHSQGRLLVGVYKGIQNKDAFGDLFVAQVKMMSFLAFLLRQYASSFSDFLAKTPDIVVRMLQDCPRDRPGARKELIVAFRHIISYSFRRIFLKSIDQLQDERILLGDGLAVQQTIRPLAFSILADLIHHLRDQLTKDQIRYTIQVYTRNLLEDYPGGSFPAMSAKLLLNMSECIARMEPKEEGRHFLMIILNAIGDKFKALNDQFDNSVKLFKRHAPARIEFTAKSYMADPKDKPDWDGVDIFYAAPILTSGHAERASDPVNDNRFLFRNLLNGLKTVFYQLRACNPRQGREIVEQGGNTQFNLSDFTYGYTAEEVKVLIKLFHEGIRTFRYFGVHKDHDESRLYDVATKVEEELLEVFATVFHHLDPATFYEVFQPEMEHFYQLILEYRPLSHVAKFLLAYEVTSPAFATMLIEFLMTKLPIIGSEDKKQSEVLLLLFKFFFLAVTMFPNHNEVVIESHIVSIITKCLELATTAEHPMNYYILLRNLFRSIGGRRFDQCYAKIQPLLEMLLETLNNLLLTARTPQDRDLFVELTLTLPAWLSDLVPYFRYLTKPLGVALRAGPDLVAQGLRTLELCVDSLIADHLDPLMASALDALMPALWEHLKPSPSNHFHSHTTLRILGKLSGRNRHFLTGHQTLDYKPYTDDEPSVDIKLIGTVRDRPFPVSLGVSTCIGILTQVSSFTATSTDIQFAYRLVSSNVKLLIGNEALPDDLAQLVRLQAEDAYNRKFDAGPNIFNRPDRETSLAKCEDQKKNLIKLVSACIHAMAIPELKDEATAFVFGLVKYFSILESGRKIGVSKHNTNPLDTSAGEGPHFISSYVLCDAIADALSSISIDVREAAIDTIMQLRDSAQTILGADKRPDQFPLFKYLARVFAHRCHQEEWFTKTGGSIGLEVLALKLGFSDEWLREWQLTFIRALLYVLKDIPYNVPSRSQVKSLEVLVAIVSRCNAGLSVSEMENPKSNLASVSSLLMYELAHIDSHVRQGARESFAAMAKVMNCSVHEILRPITPRLLQTVFMKPLRTLPFNKQIGYIESVIYIFQAGPNLVPVDENLIRLLDGLFVIADAEDTGFAPKPIEYRTLESITKLRVACIRLMTEIHKILHTLPTEQSKQRRDDIEARLLQFLNRAGMPTVVMDAAYDALLVVHDPAQKPSKHVIGVCLQPIIAVMQGQKPTVDFPDRLSRFLKLFTTCFRLETNLTLVPLLKHIKNFETQYIPLQKTSLMPMEQNPVIRLIANMLDTIHLLTQGGLTYLEPLVQQVFALELSLRRTHVSPFRLPLVHFFERYPAEAWAFFSPRLKNFPQGRFFAQLVGHTLSKNLRMAIYNKIGPLLESFGLENEIEKWPAVINGVHIIWQMAQFDETRKSVVMNADIRRVLVNAGKLLEARLKQNGFPPALHLAAIQASEQLMSVLITSMAEDPLNLDWSFDVIEAITAEELCSSPELIKFIYNHWILNDNVENCRTLLSRCISTYANQHGPSYKMKSFLFHNVVNPMLAQDVMRNWDSLFSTKKGTDLVDKSFLEVAVSRLWRTEGLSGVSDERNHQDMNSSRVEVLQMTALLIKYYPSLVHDFRKEIIRFSWNFISSDEIMIKYAAYVVLSYFIATYDTPAEMTARVYQALLKAQQNENRAIAGQGLEILAPVLKARTAPLDQEEQEKGTLPILALYPRRVISEEYHNGPQLITSFQFIIKHPDLFFDTWPSFASAIIPAFTKIAPIPGSQPENRRQIINLIRLIWQWERRSVGDLAAKEEGKRTLATAGRKSLAPYALRHGLIQYLVTFIATLGNAYPTLPYRSKEPSSAPYPEIPRTAIVLLNDIVKEPAWSDVDVTQFILLSGERNVQVVHKNLTLDKLPVEQPGVYAARIVYGLEIVKIFVNSKSNQWILDNLSTLQSLLDHSLREEIAEVQDCLHTQSELDKELGSLPIMSRILEAIPAGSTNEDDMSVDSAADDFIKYLNSLVCEGFDKGNIMSAISILGSLNERRPAEVNQHLTALMKVFTSRLVKNHNLHSTPGLRPPVQQPAQPGRARADGVNGTAPSSGTPQQQQQQQQPSGQSSSQIQPAQPTNQPGGSGANGSAPPAPDGAGSQPAASQPMGEQTAEGVSQPNQSGTSLEGGAKTENGAPKPEGNEATGSGGGASGGAGELADPSVSTPSPAELKMHVTFIVKSLDILASHANNLGDLRRHFLQAVATLVERSQSNEICLKILNICERWVFEMEDLLPTMKERVAILTKMLTFEQRSDPTLLAKYLDLVIRIYDDPKIQRSELTVRLEQAFLVGTRSTNVETRNRFMEIFDKHISRTASSRLNYLLASQDWRSLQDSFWLQQVIQLLFGSVELNSPAQLHPKDVTVLSPSLVFGMYSKDGRLKSVIVDDELSEFMASVRAFHSSLSTVKVRDLIEPISHLQHLDVDLSYKVWVSIFPLFWSAYPKDGRSAMEKALVALLTKDDHHRQMDKRPNCIQAILEGIVRVKPRMKFPPQIAKYLAKTFDAWYTAAHYLEEQTIQPLVPTPRVREVTSDALLDIYSSLHEDDLFYGVWRRRCLYVETNAALSYEQLGMWEKAQQMYDSAQLKARTGALPFSQAEYTLWEDHWIICAQKLQQWEILAEFAKHENLNDLYLEATWRNTEAWNSTDQREQLDSIIKAVSDAPTPRRLYFQSFMTLMKYYLKQASSQDVIRACDESMQLSIRKWHQLPKRITNAHVPLLQNFQSLVELTDANAIIGNLNQTNQQTLEQKAMDLKHQLTTWRDRLPNFWDDINVWQDLVTWRQHIFHLINSVYLGLLQPPQGGSQTASSNHYRGYHETAWIINRFAHVARKHHLTDVCVSQLGRIYTLPNIEIQEAFLKLREQAKCHYQNQNELNSGLEVINNTNLNYFGNAQKAEFHTLKGMFLDKLGSKTEASDAFSNALSFDLKLPKAWAEWGRFHDNLFRDEPFNMEHAASAISCYLEAASLFKNSQSRHLLSRVLWLLSLDNPERTLENTFKNFHGEHPFWYWIAFIPQLLSTLLRPQVQIARVLLMKIAKEYPQSLYFLLRTARDDFHALKRQHDANEARNARLRMMQQNGTDSQGHDSGSTGAGAGASAGSGAHPTPVPGSGHGQGDQHPPGSAAASSFGNSQSQAPTPTTANPAGTPATTVSGADHAGAVETQKKAWDHLEDILAVIKKTFPLLVLSIESLIDQISKHFKSTPDEDAYRLIVALLNDSLSYVGRNPQLYSNDVKLPPSTEANISKFASSILPAHVRPAFEAEFVSTKPTMHECIRRLRQWRNRFEDKLDARESPISLELLSAHLSEFCFQKFEDVEVPGQYLFPKDSSSGFVRIHRFLPDIDLVRGAGVSHRRLKVRGHDGSLHTFGIQHPVARHCRREEKTVQLFRVLNETLQHRRESRRRNLQFELPVIVPMTGTVRLIQDDPSAVSLMAVYENFCRTNGMNKDEPVLFHIEQLASVGPKTAPELVTALRTETLMAIQEKYVPHTVALEYFQATFPSFENFWLFRRRLSYQLAAMSLMTFAMQLSQRIPQKIFIGRDSGSVWGTELVSSIAASKPLLHNPEPVPFRLTPNMQVLMGPIGTEGIFAPSIMAIARNLTEREGELDRQLALFLRDEVVYWFSQSRTSVAAGGMDVSQLRDAVLQNCEIVVKRTVSLAQPPATGILPANQTVVDMVARAADPSKLAMCEPGWMPYL